MTQIQEQPTSKNIFPLHALKVSENTEIMVELKSGETYNGTLKGVDKFMNLRIDNAYLTDPKGEVFYKVEEVYIRGNVIKYFILDDSALKKIESTEYKAPEKFSYGKDKGRPYKKNSK